MAARKKAARKRAASKRSGSRAKSGRAAASTRAGGKQAKATGASATRKTTGRTGGKAAGKSSARKRAGGKNATFVRTDEPAFAEIAALARLMEEHGLVEVKFSASPDGGRKIHVAKAGRGAVLAAGAPAAWAEAGHGAPAEPAAPAEGASGEVLHAFTSPMVGTFYRAPSPEAPPFASVGDTVDPASVVCIIEAMKVMNEINPDVAGEVVSIEVENGEAVEFGQTLMLVRPR